VGLSAALRYRLAEVPMFALLVAAACSDYEISPKGSTEAVPVEETEPPTTTPGPTTPPTVPTTPTEACLCPDGYTALPADDGCAARTEVPAVFAGSPLDVCPLIAHPDYSRLGARYPGGLVVADAFFGLDNLLADGRMNATGVWACDPSTGLAGANPANEWIGFSVCVDIATPGDYLLGLGADNRTRFAVDGVLLREDPSDDVLNFQYWWVTPVQLTSGTHIVSFEGFNAGGPAGLGAEIAGPFPVGSLVDDAAMAAADYAGNLVWTATDAVGSTFALGETNGWSCPDGMALDLCAAEPVCYAEDVVPCL
jgi:hypothetical protein